MPDDGSLYDTYVRTYIHMGSKGRAGTQPRVPCCLLSAAVVDDAVGYGTAIKSFTYALGKEAVGHVLCNVLLLHRVHTYIIQVQREQDQE